MDKAVWLQQFDDTCETFKWFFLKYGYQEDWLNLLQQREMDNMDGMKNIMNQIWFELPDHIFNIMENPHGWTEFLNLIEE